MIRGIYTGACGMLANEVRQNVVANNLANVDTTGFRRDVPVFSMEPDNQIHRINDYRHVIRNRYVDRSQYIGNMGTGSVVADVYTPAAAGQIKITDKSTDFALAGPGFFSVETPEGTKYTRAGNFTITQDGLLTDSQGNYILGEAGRGETGKLFGDHIKVDPGVPITVSEDGSIFQNGQYMSKFQIVEFGHPDKLQKAGGNMFVPAAENDDVTISANTRVQQGNLESSNVNAVNEMVSMIELQRAYELNQRVILTQDEMLQRAISTVGKITA